MSTLMRTALENANIVADESERTIIMKGPLAEIYTQALATAYAKEDPVTGQASMESQANDALTMQRLQKAMQPQDVTPAQFTTVYGVSKYDVNEQTVVEVTQSLGTKPNPQDFVIIIDATQPGANGEGHSGPQERIEYLSSALEALVEAHGGKVYPTFVDFAKAF